jgi:type IX secretion system PorP/SprF family membrane protein
MRKRASIFIIFFLFGGFLFAQDIHFSQINNTPLLLNPSLAGFINGGSRTIINYKEQWRSITVPYRTIAASFDLPLFTKSWKSNNLGMGGTLISDKAGDAEMGLTQFNLSLSYDEELSRSSDLLFGLQAGYCQRSFDITKLSWDNQYDGNSYDPSLPSNEPFNYNNNFNYFDLSGGIAWSYAPNANNQTLLGVSLYHINRPQLYYYQTSDERLNPKLVVHWGANFHKKYAKLTYSPSLIYFRQASQQEFTFGSMFRFRLREASQITGFYDESAISFGVWYRLDDAVIPCIRYEFGGKYTIEISYDTNVSELTDVSHSLGGFEIALMFIPHAKSKRDLVKPIFH